MVIEIAAVIACFMLFSLTIFQLILAMGYPIGKFAWGGSHTVLPTKLRIASAISVLLYAGFAMIILSSSGVLKIINNESITNTAIWVLTVYFFLGVLMNGISRSKSERSVMTPAAMIIAICCLLIAIN